MPTVVLLRDNGFDTGATEILCKAFDKAVQLLPAGADGASSRNRLATLVIRLFAAGERDGDQLAGRALVVLAQSAAPSPPPDGPTPQLADSASLRPDRGTPAPTVVKMVAPASWPKKLQNQATCDNYFGQFDGNLERPRRGDVGHAPTNVVKGISHEIDGRHVPSSAPGRLLRREAAPQGTAEAREEEQQQQA